MKKDGFIIKKHSCLLLVLLFVFAFTGCSNDAADSTSEKSEKAGQTESSTIGTDTQGETEAGQTEQNDSGKTAVVYFSATGTTEEVANQIAEETGADIFEIVPEEPYTSEDLNYSDDNCRANKEMNDEAARPAISSDLSVVSEYDVIYLGYPVWWGTAPRIIQTFLENSDISQAAVYTFCTSGGSGIEQSVEDLQGLYPDVNIVSGRRFGQGADADVKEWIEEHISSKQ
ncbi:flavodoxin [Extibacter muris]|uniref:flavodoxin n=1 Tax=Extibacter muris TaxID=1796622 RepID=UPI001D05DB59|nr:flavodoxin [Extibacter muris]MCB6202236.1 flavodoxin [Extibacter muris]MCQ4662671.1 flavodoxin [Extibacter muris]MCQ4693046.1 flavodoxin [Extibacter muris]